MASIRDYSPFVPFDLYDFFGYLFPGILFATSTSLFFFQIKPAFISSLLQNGNMPTEIPFLFGLVAVIFGIVIFYTIGHFIATISHIIIDRVLIDGVEGYPINYLLKIPRIERLYSESTFKYLFASFNFLLLGPIFIYNDRYLHWWLNIFIITIVALIVQRSIIMLIRSTVNGLDIAEHVGSWPVLRLFLLPSKFLIDPFIGFLRRLLGLDRRFPDSFIDLYRKVFVERFPGLSPDDVGSENFWLPSIYVNAYDDNRSRTLHTWLHLYGFARNASASFYISASLIVGHIYFNHNIQTPFVIGQLSILWIMAAILGLRYWILYSHYYSKGVIRAFVESMTRSNGGT